MHIVRMFCAAAVLCAAQSESMARINPASPFHPAMTNREKLTALRPYIEHANRCVITYVFGRDTPPELGDRIVASMTPCKDAVRKMMDAHDRLFGENTGEEFFMRTYLDVVSEVVESAAKSGRSPSENGY